MSVRPTTNFRIVVFAPQILEPGNRSGLQRVTLECILALCRTAGKTSDGRIAVDLATWDPVEGQMRHYNRRQLGILFADHGWPKEFTVHPSASKLGIRFADTISQDDEVCVLMPEVFFLVKEGNELYARVISQCICYGWRTASIFYDMIPLKNPLYYRLGGDFPRYLAEMLRLDDILCISKYSANQLVAEYDRFGLSEARLAEHGQRIRAIPLPATAVSRAVNPKGSGKPKSCIVMVGTVEERKRQTQVVRAFTRLSIGQRSGLKLRIFGGLHPGVAQEFHDAVAADPDVDYSGYSTDHQISEAYAEALFSVFASDDEGFGLPITESLAHGVPCLTASFGAMAEAAQGGGCLTVDVRDDQALGAGLERMALDDALITQLRSEIVGRKSRTWEDYAHDFWTVLFHDRIASTGLDKANTQLNTAIRRRAPTVELEIDVSEGQVGLSVRLEILYDCGSLQSPKWKDSRESDFRVAVALGEIQGWSDLDSEMISALTYFDAIMFETNAIRDTVLGAAARHQVPRMLPGWFWVLPEEGGYSGIVVMLAKIVSQRRRRQVIANRESNMHAASRDYRSSGGNPVLTIMISTYNRSSFITMNVDWILRNLPSPRGSVELVVVDNASTDDTLERLAPYSSNPDFHYIRNSDNVGMLGNLAVCSTLMRGRHVWIIGDDDFIAPEMIKFFLEKFVSDNTIPLAFMNFGVYHREMVEPGDSPELFLSEMKPLATEPVRAGRLRVSEIGLQHDNLFTAIYAMIFRSDILAAVFNYPFTGQPFRSLVESVPTSKVILSVYADVVSEWVDVCCLMGNAHNSWQHHRVAWHGVLMPLVFELARQAGLDADLLHQWARLHSELFREAQLLFPDASVIAEFSVDDLSVGRRILGCEITEQPSRTAHTLPPPSVVRKRQTRVNPRQT